MTEYINRLKQQLLSGDTFRFAQLYTTFMKIPKKFLSWNDKGILMYFQLMSTADETTAVTELEITHQEIAFLCGLSHDNVKKIMPGLPKRVDKVNKANLLGFGESIKLTARTIKGIKNIYTFEYIPPVRRSRLEVNAGIPPVRTKVPSDEMQQYYALSVMELQRFGKLIPLEEIKHVASVHPYEHIKNSINYYFKMLERKKQKDPHAVHDKYYFMKILSHPEWYKSMLMDQKKVIDYAERLVMLSEIIKEVFIKNKIKTQINFDDFTKLRDGQVRLINIENVKMFNKILRGNLTKLSDDDFRQVHWLKDKCYMELNHNARVCPAGKSAETIKEDILLTLLQARFTTINLVG